ncbi:MAG: D-alanine--D-alanine ligase family protein [Solirubrobacteraceae bacterium]
MPVHSLNVAVVFGGRSVEHDVSIITGIQACEVLSVRHRPLPVYIDRAGRWYAGERLLQIDAYRQADFEELAVTFDVGAGVLTQRPSRQRGLRGRRGGEPTPFRPDVVLPATHGTQGEDGCLQGLLELSDLPYAGPTHEAAVLAMNKAITKALLRSAGVPVLDDLVLRREEFAIGQGAGSVKRVTERFSLPVYVKPVSLGSSIGVSRCSDESELLEALELAFELDRTVLVEPAVQAGIEVNCAVLGRPGVGPRASVCEQPVASNGFLSFEDKYMRGGKAPAGKQAGKAGMSSMQRLIPAPIPDEQAQQVKRLAEQTFTTLGCAGVARVDTLIDAHGQIYVNECNTIPGSFAFYLWEPAGMPFADLMDELLELALAEHRERTRTTRTFESNLLTARAGGAKS